MGDIIIYSRRGCTACHGAKQLLKRKGLPFYEFDLTVDPDAERDLVEQTGQKTVPQIFINGQFVGGLAELVALEKRGGLLAMLTGMAIAAE